jgi:hypothetical protein
MEPTDEMDYCGSWEAAAPGGKSAKRTGKSGYDYSMSDSLFLFYVK